MLAHHRHGLFHVHLLGVVFHVPAIHPRRDDVEKRQHARLGVHNHLCVKLLEVIGARTSRVHRRRHAIAERVVIGIEIELRALRVEMRMDIDEARRHAILAGIDRSARLPSR